MSTSSIGSSYGVSITEITCIATTTTTSSSLFFPPKFNSLFSTSLLLSSFSLSSTHSDYNYNKVTHILRVSSQGLPGEIDEDSKFVPLNEEDPSYGPPAILLVGFRVEESDKIQELLKELEGDFLEVIYCTDDMITLSLWDAVNTKQQSLEKLKIAKSVPRLCFLSGLTGEEMMMFIDAFEETDLEPAVFAAHVPNSSSKPLQEVIEEVMGDHEMVTEDSEKP